jgi:predicted RecB family nuclease
MARAKTNWIRCCVVFVFVDLLSVVRHSLRAGVESYSIKKLEPLYGYVRDASLPDANLALNRLQVSLELNDAAGILPEDKQTVEVYNRDDCVSTRSSARLAGNRTHQAPCSEASR